MTDTDRYRQLRTLAERATQGRWRQIADTPWGSKVVINESGEMYVGVSAITAVPTDGWHESARQRARQIGANKCADAAYIAALCPEVVLDLLHELESLTAANEQLRAGLRP
jgi:hypothetical protein